MKNFKGLMFTASTLVLFMSAALPANAAGCLKGAAVGGVAGHFAHHHAILGAAAGCAIGHHRASVAARQQAAQARSAPAAGPR